MNDTNFGILNNMVLAYTNALSGAYNNLNPTVTYIIGFAITVSVVLGAASAAMSDEGMPGILRFLVSKFLVIGWCLYLVANWQGITNMIAGGAVELGFKAAGSSGTATNFLNDPATIIEDGYNLCLSMIDAALKMPNGLLSAIKDAPMIAVYTIAAFISLIAYILIAIDILFTILVFQIVSIAAVVFMGFKIWDKTAFLADRSYTFLGNSFLKLFTMALVIGIGMGYLNQFTVNPVPDLGNAISIMAGSLMLLFLAFFTPRIASELVSGGTSHSGGIGAIAAAAILKQMQTPAPPPPSGSNGGGGNGGGGGAGTNSGLEQMRRAATVGGGADANTTTLSQMAKAAESRAQNAGSPERADT